MSDDTAQPDQPKLTDKTDTRRATLNDPHATNGTEASRETVRQQWMKAKAEEIDQALGIESGSFAPTDGGGFVQKGSGGAIIMGMGDDQETAPRPMPPEAELRKAAETPHNHPDLAQPPLRDQFADDTRFNVALTAWLVNVAPAVVRRNKRLERIQLKPGATAKEIVDAIRARSKASH